MSENSCSCSTSWSQSSHWQVIQCMYLQPLITDSIRVVSNAVYKIRYTKQTNYVVRNTDLTKRANPVLLYSRLIILVIYQISTVSTHEQLTLWNITPNPHCIIQIKYTVFRADIITIRVRLYSCAAGMIALPHCRCKIWITCIRVNSYFQTFWHCFLCGPGWQL